MTKNLETWTISSRGEKRFSLGHPWVFSNEISNSLKSVETGDLVQLANQKGQFLALGYGNPHSLIAFRTLSRSNHPINEDWLVSKFIEAAKFRAHLGLTEHSHRLVFSEADGLPGLIVDCFKTSYSQQVFVLEILTAGIEKLLSVIVADDLFKNFLKTALANGLAYLPWEQTSLVLKKDNSFRKMENLPIIETEVCGALSANELSNQEILISQSLHRKESIGFHTDLVHGQKTGFFLDQRSNIQLLLSQMPTLKASTPEQPIRILDLFCFAGQWSGQIARELKSRGHFVEVTCADASQKALDFAVENTKKHCQKVTPLKMDIVEKCQDLPHGVFDIVICDPPALIKSKKDHPAGKNAYTKVNTAALRSLNKSGIFISCSCSQHLSDEDLVEVLTMATLKSRKNMNWIAKGQQGPDHPMRLEFPQGTYLNSWLGLAKEGLP
jgi:23S rRNA (cytosine1962-C5)-methyltransferase